MRTYLACYPCLVRQAVESAGRTTSDPRAQRLVVDAVLRRLLSVGDADTPPQIAQTTHRILREKLGAPDLYAAEKREYNERALALLPRLRAMVVEAPDSLGAALRLALAGNVIDFGAHENVIDLEAEIAAALECELDPTLLAELRQRLDRARAILYLGDNAGEIVFDRVLIESLLSRGCSGITYVVRGIPILNDATLEDARAVGLTELVRVIGNGSDAPGTVLSEVTDEVRQLVENADVIIAKGQGNYETLSKARGRLYYLFKVKCPVVAQDVGMPLGSHVLTRGA